MTEVDVGEINLPADRVALPNSVSPHRTKEASHRDCEDRCDGANGPAQYRRISSTSDNCIAPFLLSNTLVNRRTRTVTLTLQSVTGDAPYGLTALGYLSTRNLTSSIGKIPRARQTPTRILCNLPLVYSQEEGVLSKSSFRFAWIDSVSQEVASVLMARLGTFKTYFRIGSQGQLFALPRKGKSVVPASPALRRHQKIHAPANSHLSRVTHRLDITNILFGLEASG